MRGKRWKAVTEGYTRCLAVLEKMEEIIISTLTFDQKPNLHGAEKTAAAALANAKKLPFTAGDTNFDAALQMALDLISKSQSPQYANYLNVILLLSDGVGGYPTEQVQKILTMRENGKKVLFFTIACETEEDQDMIKMAQQLKGEHFKAADALAIKQLFAKIITS